MYANMVMLGAFIKITSLVSKKAIEKTIRESVSEKTVETNINAFRKGLQLLFSFFNVKRAPRFATSRHLKCRGMFELCHCSVRS
jgi:hypothetical protein